MHPNYGPPACEPQRVTSSSGLYAKSAYTPPASSSSESGEVESPGSLSFPLRVPEKISYLNLVKDDLAASSVNAIAGKQTVSILSLYIYHLI